MDANRNAYSESESEVVTTCACSLSFIHRGLKSTTEDWFPEIISNPHSYLQFPVSNNEWTVCEGLARTDHCVILEVGRRGRIMADVENQSFLRADDVDLNKVKHNAIVDLSDDGDRWEGDALNEQPFGWGVLYDKDNRKVYEGFRMDGVNICYGCKYYADISQIEYEGELCEGMRWGRGVQYDRNGFLVYEGEWVNDAPLERKLLITPDNEILHSRIEELVIDDNSGNREDISTVHLSSLPLLNTIQIHNNCFKYVHDVRIENLPALESITIGRHSFKQTDDGFSQRDAQFSCCGNPHLRSIHIGPYSFTEFNSFTVKGTCGMRS